MHDAALLLRVAVLPYQTLDAFNSHRLSQTLGVTLHARATLEQNTQVLSDRLYGVAGPREEGDMAPEVWQARNAVLALRRDVHNQRPCNPEQLERARPMLGVLAGELEGFDASLRRTKELETQFDRMYADELSRERQALLYATRRPEFMESVWLASRSLFHAMEKLPRRDVTTWRNEETHSALKILAYLIRGATKTSPNALFAATAPASFGSALRARGGGQLAHVRTRLNVSEARKVTACLSADPSLKGMIHPRLNTTLRATQDGWAWWREASLRREEDEEVFLEAEHHAVLDRVIHETRSEEVTWARLVDVIVSESGASRDDADRFLDKLVDRGILLAEVEIPSLEADPVAHLAESVREGDLHPEWLPDLERIKGLIATETPIGSPDRRALLLQAGRLLDALPHVRSLSEDELLRVDAESAFDIELPRSLQHELWQAADAYVRMFAALYPFTRRELYRDLFIQEYSADTEVPALEVHQRFAEPEFETALGALPEPSCGTDALGDLKRRLLTSTEPEVQVEVDEFLDLVPSRDPGRWMAGALFQVALPKGGDVSDPKARIVLNGLFHGCGLALSRFHDLHPGNAISRTLREGWSSLIPEGAIPAEINYLPWGRAANASLRPRLFEHEIELPGERASKDCVALRLYDLSIRYASADGRFHITSHRLGREVVPILSSGVRPQGFTSFLVHAGMQDLFPVAFFPGLDDPDVVHWPRLTLGRVVLFRERWVFGRDRHPERREAAGPRWFERLERWRRQYELPARVFVGSSRHGKPFFVDLTSPLMAELFRRFLVSLDDADRCVLSEMLPGPDELWLKDEQGSYASEFLTQLEGGVP